MQPVPPAGSTVNVSNSVAWIYFPTTLGWVGIGWTDEGLAGVRIGYPSREEIQTATGVATEAVPPLWCQRLKDRLEAYCAGAVDDFRDVPLATLWSTPFQNEIISALRAVPYGDRTTYRDLANQVGRPGAARAVGQVMATNPVPLVVPCHRVLASGGGLGGFSAPTGTALKQQLLDMEVAGVESEAAATTGRR